MSRTEHANSLRDVASELEYDNSIHIPEPSSAGPHPMGIQPGTYTIVDVAIAIQFLADYVEDDG